jgi:hypothetical protein
LINFYHSNGEMFYLASKDQPNKYQLQKLIGTQLKYFDIKGKLAIYSESRIDKSTDSYKFSVENSSHRIIVDVEKMELTSFTKSKE